MKKPASLPALDEFARVQLSKTFFMRDFLYSEIGHLHGLSNIPDEPDLAIKAGKKIGENLLEPLQDRFGRLAIRSAYRSKEVNGFGNAQQKAKKSGYTCASNEKTTAIIFGTSATKTVILEQLSALSCPPSFLCMIAV